MGCKMIISIPLKPLCPNMLMPMTSMPPLSCHVLFYAPIQSYAAFMFSLMSSYASPCPFLCPYAPPVSLSDLLNPPPMPHPMSIYAPLCTPTHPSCAPLPMYPYALLCIPYVPLYHILCNLNPYVTMPSHITPYALLFPNSDWIRVPTNHLIV